MVSKAADARTRLQDAALSLFWEQGFDSTTAAQIADRAGVTERTFFRYFPDKREALFDGAKVLEAALRAGISAAPRDFGALDTLLWSFRSVVPLLEGNRPFAKPRHEIIRRTPALAERELTKTAALADALAEGLTDRGIPASDAALAAKVGMVVLVEATVSWLEDEGEGLAHQFDRMTGELRTLCDGFTGGS